MGITLDHTLQGFYLNRLSNGLQYILSEADYAVFKLRKLIFFLVYGFGFLNLCGFVTYWKIEIYLCIFCKYICMYNVHIQNDSEIVDEN